MPLPEPAPAEGSAWRFAEAQHRVSTMQLVDTLDEQRLLEELLDATKPPVPPDCAGLHYLFFTPFRYAARHATRFRRQGERAGVLYAARRIATAAAEMAFYRLLFYVESPATEPPAIPAEMTAFSLRFATGRAYDLTGPGLDPALYSRTDYTACHALAERARAEGVEMIRYPSVREAARGENVAVLTCRAIARNRPDRQETWHFRVTGTGVLARRDRDGGGYDFRHADFAADPRIADWLAGRA